MKLGCLLVIFLSLASCGPAEERMEDQEGRDASTGSKGGGSL